MIWLLKRVPYYILSIVACYAAYCMPPESNPYAFAACSIGIIYGVFGLVGGQEIRDSIVKGVVDDLIDFAPLAMMNIEIYNMLEKPYAKVHGLFIIPLALDLIAKLFGEECDDEPTQALKHASNLANVVSILYIAFKETNLMFGTLAILFLGAQLGMALGGNYHKQLVKLNYVICYTSFYMASILAIKPNAFGSSGGEAVKSETPAIEN